jgi:hypothetical protein
LFGRRDKGARAPPQVAAGVVDRASRVACRLECGSRSWYATPQNTALTVTSHGATLTVDNWDPEGSAISALLVSGPRYGPFALPFGYRGFASHYRASDEGVNTKRE